MLYFTLLYYYFYLKKEEKIWLFVLKPLDLYIYIYIYEIKYMWNIIYNS